MHRLEDGLELAIDDMGASMGSLDLTKPEGLGLYQVLDSPAPQRLDGLTVADYQRFDASNTILVGVERWSNSIAMVRSNHGDLLAYLAEAETEASVFDFTPDSMARVYFHANRRLMNLLAAANMFLEHTKAFLGDKYGSDSQQVADFIKSTNNAYDGEFAYRFLTRLRNFALHSGLPLGSLDHESKRNERTGRETYTLRLMFDVNSLLGGYDCWSTVRTELETMRPTIALSDQPDRFVAALVDLDESAFKLQLPELIHAGQEVLSVISPGYPTAGKSSVVGQEIDEGYGMRGYRYEVPVWSVLERLGLI
jgi:hypothetical protein